MNDQRKQPPTHRVFVYHDEEHYTEVGACWAHSKGGGFNITFKEGLQPAAGARIVAYPNTPREDREDKRDNDRDKSGRGRR